MGENEGLAFLQRPPGRRQPGSRICAQKIGSFFGFLRGICEKNISNFFKFTFPVRVSHSPLRSVMLKASSRTNRQ
jgi:hypothetical protein